MLAASWQVGFGVSGDAGIPLSAACWGWGKGAPRGWLPPGVSRCRKHDGVLSLHMPPGSLCPDPVTPSEKGKGGRKAGSPPSLAANMERRWPLSIFASGAGLQGPGGGCGEGEPGQGM